MAAFQSRSRGSAMFSPALFNFDHLETHVQTHLKNVYACLSVGMLSAALGSYAHFWTGLGQWYLVTVLASIGLLLWLANTRNRKEDVAKRMGIFSAFTFTSGVSLGPLLETVIRIDPTIISTALAGTAVVFVSFTLSALLSRDRTFLYLGGFLMSGLSWLLLISVVNIFFRSSMLLDIHIYGILFVFCGFVLYDTQLIVEKKRRGDDDFIWHSIDLFLDAINIFKALLVILARREDGKKKRNNN